jgi:DNA-binding beta-propeller fold protein YncE
MKAPFVLLCVACSVAQAGSIFLGAHPDGVLVVDEATQRIIDKFPTQAGLPTGMRMSYDRKKIYLTSGDHAGVSVVDIATRKVVNHFVLNSGSRQIRFSSGVAPDPQDKLLYTVVTEVVKQVDRFEIGKPKYAVIDLAQQKIVRTADIAEEDEEANVNTGDSFFRPLFFVSPDGKYLYHFRDNVVVLDTTNFKVVERIALAKPNFPGVMEVGVGSALESLNEPGYYTSLFNAVDPNVRRKMFGIARFDLNNRAYEFSPIGPSPDGMLGLEVTPDHKTAYTVVTNGEYGTRRCEFWALDLTRHQRTMTNEFPCRPRFSFSISSTGKELYIYGAGFQIEVYDAATLKLKRTTDLQNDVTMAGIVVAP